VSSGNEFLTPENIIAQAFAHIFGGIFGVSQEVRESLLIEYVKSHQSGDFRRQVKALKEWLSGVEWTWPWLDGWIETFLETGCWPWLCKSLVESIKNGDADEINHERIVVLADTIFRASHSFYEKTKDWSDSIYDYRLEADTISAEPADRHVTDKVAAFNAGNHKEWPPFMPGDMTQVRWRRMRRRSIKPDVAPSCPTPKPL
jgi:hypothetical protein